MKLFKTLLTILFISLLSSPSWSATIDDLVERNDLFYEKFSDVPFTGKVTGNPQGSFKNGKKQGAWVDYYESGQLRRKGNYKNGKAEGAWIRYYESGQLSFKNDYKNGKAEGAAISYHENGQLSFKGNFKNNLREGIWVSYNKDGTVEKEYAGIFKNDVKISD